MSAERLIVGVSGWLMASVAGVLLLGGAAAVVVALGQEDGWLAGAAGVALLIGAVIVPGLFINQPNQSRVVTLFGHYSGTVRENGFRWVNR